MTYVTWYEGNIIILKDNNREGSRSVPHHKNPTKLTGF